MAVGYSPKIILDGLSLTLDAGVPTSWNAGISTNWTDKVGGNNGTLVGGMNHNDGPFVGAGYVEFDGTDDYLSVSSSADFSFGTGDFTVEYWLYVNGIPANNNAAYVTDFRGGNTNNFTFGILNNGGALKTYSWGNSTQVIGDTPLSTDTWYHIAHVRSGTTVTMYLNGFSDGSMTNGFSQGSTGIIIGARHNTSQEFVNGYISNLRILKGTALYTSDFTVPTHELEVIGDTLLLCCNNPDSAAAASYAGIGTSKTITVNGDAAASTFSPGLIRDFTFGTQFEGVTTFDTQGYFVPPSGTTEQRYVNVASNAVDSSSARGLIGGGNFADTNEIDYITIATTGDAQDLGDLTIARSIFDAVSSSTRGIWGGGYVQPSPTTAYNTIDFVTISTLGNAQDFVDLTDLIRYPGGISDSTRGVFMGGYVAPARINSIEYITMASTGDSNDFGDLSVGTIANNGCGSPTRGIIYSDNAPGYVNSISYITIQSMGNAQDFGDSTNVRGYIGSCSSTTRALFGGGTNPSPGVDFNIIDYVTIATTGNAVDFGDLVSVKYSLDATSSLTRGVFTGGALRPGSTIKNEIDYVTIASLGDAVDFGNLQSAKLAVASCSNGHGGLG